MSHLIILCNCLQILDSLSCNYRVKKGLLGLCVIILMDHGHAVFAALSGPDQLMKDNDLNWAQLHKFYDSGLKASPISNCQIQSLHSLLFCSMVNILDRNLFLGYNLQPSGIGSDTTDSQELVLYYCDIVIYLFVFL